MAQKLNESKGPVKFVIPTTGWWNLSVEGADLYDPETHKGFVAELGKHSNLEIEVAEVGTYFNTPEFARAAVDALGEMMKAM